MKLNSIQTTNFNGKLIVTGDRNSYLRCRIESNKTLNETAQEAGEYNLCAIIKKYNGNGQSYGTDGDFYKLSFVKTKGEFGILDSIKSKLPFAKADVSKSPHSDKTILRLLEERFTKESLKSALKIK